MKPLRLNQSLSYFASIAKIAFLGLVGLLTIVKMIAGPGTLREERDAPTPQWPRSAETLKAYPGAVKYYIEKRYGLKKWFIRINSGIKRYTFHHSPYDRVILGKQGVLFLGEQSVIDSLQGRPPSPESETDHWVAFFVELDEAYEAQNLPLIVIIAPDKHAILKERLPDWLNPVSIVRSQTISKLLANELRVPPVDLVSLFNQTKRDVAPPYYHHTDTHWTEYGAAVAVDSSLLGALVEQPILPEMNPEEYSTGGGDLARMIGMQENISTVETRLRRPEDLSCVTTEGQRIDIVSLDPLPWRRFHCENSAAPYGSALVHMDSFGMAAAPRLVQLFRHVEFVWGDQVDMAIADEVSPDLVIRIMVARKLQHQNPSELVVRRP